MVQTKCIYGSSRQKSSISQYFKNQFYVSPGHLLEGLGLADGFKMRQYKLQGLLLQIQGRIVIGGVVHASGNVDDDAGEHVFLANGLQPGNAELIGGDEKFHGVGYIDGHGVGVEVFQNGEENGISHLGERDGALGALAHFYGEHGPEIRGPHEYDLVRVDGAIFYEEGDIGHGVVVYERSEIGNEGGGGDGAG